MQIKLVRIVAAVVDTSVAVFYKEDGTTIEVPQGDPRLRPLLESATPQLTTQGYADLDFSHETGFVEFEEKAKGIRFFKIAKEKLKAIFGKKPDIVDPITMGKLPMDQLIAQRTAVLNEIMDHAVPVKEADLSTVAPQRPTVEGGRTPNDSRANDGSEAYYDKHPDTIVAVTQTGKVIPNVERIQSQFTAAAKSGNTKGMEKFMSRAGSVAAKRKHSVEDLLRFMERGDLPVANDGSIIIYKKLYRQNGCYVDPHTRLVTQRIGSYVHMDESLVDHNRRNECSNGLHVGRRGYMGYFNGDVIVLAKVRPEDVIAVPEYDANKMRVCGYHILFELTQQQYNAINSNRSMDTVEGGAELLGRAIAGDHVGVLEHVKITGQRGTGLRITSMDEKAPESPLSQEPTPEKVVSKKKALSQKKLKKAKRKAKQAAKAKKAAKPVSTIDANQGLSDAPVDVRKVTAKMDDSSVSLDASPAPTGSQHDVAKGLWLRALEGDAKAAQELLDFKKQAKKGWKVWGIPDTATTTLKAMVSD